MVEGYTPGDTYPAVSITGYKCWLMCSYCRGRWLRGMIPAPTLLTLEKLIERLARRGAQGLLISGGFDRRGRLPITPMHIKLLKIARRLGLRVSIHTGFVGDTRRREMLLDAVDTIDYEVPVADKQLEYMNLHGIRTVEDYLNDLQELLEAGFDVAPHVLIGLPGVDPHEELETIIKLLKLRISKLVVLIYTAPSNPRYSDICVDRAARIVQLVKAMRGDVELILGCMRPRGLDAILHYSGVLGLFARVANPSSRVSHVILGTRHCCCSVKACQW